MEEALDRVEVTVVDWSMRLQDLKSLEDRWVCDLGTVLGPHCLYRNKYDMVVGIAEHITDTILSCLQVGNLKTRPLLYCTC